MRIPDSDSFVKKILHLVQDDDPIKRHSEQGEDLSRSHA